MSEKTTQYLSPLRYLTCGLVLLSLGLIYRTTTTPEIVQKLDVPVVENVVLSDTEIEDIRRLGLSPRTPVKIITSENGEKIINGRFLHVTDFHPDPLYKEGMSPESACHARGEGSAGKYGDAILGCDSPMLLVSDTIDWIKRNLKDKIDFVIWTGDNVRHDNDRRYPRTEQSIFELNEHVSNLMFDAFKHNDTDHGNSRLLEVSLIPSLGNNDVYPHNLFSPGPTLQTRELFKIWQNFVPQSQLHIFNRGAYFFQEVIPNHLAVLSINTLYLFQSNPLVDNCDSKKQPGYQLFEWLGYVLKEMRARNMKVWLSGHVPPNEKNYDVSCLRKYIVWSHEYRDVIIGGLYGHMNLDHFIPLDAVAAYKSIEDSFGSKIDEKELKELKYMAKSIGSSSDDSELDLDSDYESDSDLEEDYSLNDSSLYSTFESHDDFRAQGGVPSNKVRYMEGLRETIYATIKGKKRSGKLGERYSIAHVTASVIPTFNPGIRVWEYNITNLKENMELNSKYGFASWDEFFTGLNTMFEKQVYEDEEHTYALKRDKTFPPKKPDHLLPGPAYIPQLFTPERYVQYYADLESINSGKKEFGYEFEYATDDKLYGLKDLTVKEWIKFGRKLGQPVKESTKGKKGKKGKKDKKKKKKLQKLERIWDEYLKNSFVSSDYENKGYG